MEDQERPSVPITPQTRVGELLDAYPELEKVLIEMSPSFAKLRNPVLRKTVAKVTSLSQAARVGNLSIENVVNRLRQAAGIEESFEHGEVEAQSEMTRPEWFDQAKIRVRLDARPLLEGGEKPVAAVMVGLNSLRPGEIYQLTAPFLPAPLIDMAKAKGFEAWTVAEVQDVVRVYFCRPGASQSVGTEQLVDLL